MECISIFRMKPQNVDKSDTSTAASNQAWTWPKGNRSCMNSLVIENVQKKANSIK